MVTIPPGDPWKVHKPTYASTPTTPPEQKFITDDAEFMARLLAEQWSLGLEEEMNISYVPEAYATDARVGHIYVYMISRTIDNIASIDYRTLKRTCRLGIRINNRFRDRNFMWAEEVTRILLEWRRAGQAKLNGWSFMEISGDNQMNNMSGYYTTTIEVKYTKFNQGINSPGFGAPNPMPNPARPIEHTKLNMRPFDIQNAQSGVISVKSVKNVVHPEVEQGTSATIQHELGVIPADGPRPHDIYEVNYQSHEGSTEERAVTNVGYSTTTPRPSGPKWEHRMFEPMGKPRPPNDDCSQNGTN